MTAETFEKSKAGARGVDIKGQESKTTNIQPSRHQHTTIKKVVEAGGILNSQERLKILQVLAPGIKPFVSFAFLVSKNERAVRAHCKVLEGFDLLQSRRQRCWGVSKQNQRVIYGLTDFGRECLAYYGGV